MYNDDGEAPRYFDSLDRGKFYRLDENRQPVPCDLLTWGKSLEGSIDTRSLAVTWIGESEISTMFLGLDHQLGDGPPLLFETIVFGGPLGGEMDRCSTYQEAEVMHAAMVKRVAEASPWWRRLLAWLRWLGCRTGGGRRPFSRRPAIW